MSDVLIGSGKATGMFFTAPKGTALPAYPSEALGADWTEVGAITEDGISLTLPSGDVLRNWALVAERKVNTENGTVSAPIMHTTKNGLFTFTANVAPRIIYRDGADWSVFKDAIEANPTTPLMDPNDPVRYYNFMGQVVVSNPVELRGMHGHR